MKQLDIVRLVLAGLVSGIVIYVVESILNGVILGADWKVWSVVASQVFRMPAETKSLILWGLQALLAGLIGTVVYAAIRTWVGVNLRAAYISGLIVWSVGWLGMSFDKLALGIEPTKMIYYNLLAALLACLLGQVAASFIYKDKAS